MATWLQVKIPEERVGKPVGTATSAELPVGTGLAGA